MKKNVVTIIFLFLVIFVTLMFGQDVEGFDLPYDQTDYDATVSNSGTYFTRKDGSDNIFSKFKEMSQAIRDKYRGEIDTCLNNANTNSGRADCRFNNITLDATSSTEIAAMQTLATLAANPTLSALKIPTPTHDATKATISATNASNKATRQELDQKMSEMLNDKIGMKLESETKRSAATYTSIVGTVLAATALYYIFLNF